MAPEKKPENTAEAPPVQEAPALQLPLSYFGCIDPHDPDFIARYGSALGALDPAVNPKCVYDEIFGRTEKL